jgi:hypothetical protein
LWDDLYNYDDSYTGQAYYWYNEEDGCFIVEWKNFGFVNGPSYPSHYATFQCQIRDPERYPTRTGDAEILFQYLEYNNAGQGENYATIGIEDPTETRGLLYSFNNEFLLPNQELSDETALLFTTGEDDTESTGGPAGIPAALTLASFPNPFNPTLTFRLTATSAVSGRLEVFNLLGERVALIYSGMLSPGVHHWEWHPRDLSSGVYLYQWRGGQGTSLRGKCLLTR